MKQAEINIVQSAYLDFVRGAAALFVLFGHSSIMFLDGSFLKEMNIQTAGVLLFFLLSGFLISYSVFKKFEDKNYSFTSYFIDRFCRIYCAFIPALFFVWIVDSITISIPLQMSAQKLEEVSYVRDLHENFNLITWIGNVLMLQDFPLFQVGRILGIPDNKFFIDEFGSASPFWTICIEWWIYMLFGAIVVHWIKNKKKFTVLQLPVLGFIAITPAYYMVGGPDNCLTLLWLLGMSASLIFINLPKWLAKKESIISKVHWTLMCLALTLAGILAMAARLFAIKLDTGKVDFDEFQFSLFLAVSLFSGLILFGNFQKIPLTLKKIFSFVADYSYSLYLTHATILTYLYVKYPGHDYDVKLFWASIVASNILAIIFWFLFERHHRKLAKILKNKFVTKT